MRVVLPFMLMPFTLIDMAREGLDAVEFCSFGDAAPGISAYRAWKLRP